MHTEAPSSVTYKIKTPNGFNVLFTVRDESEEDLLRKMEALELRFIDEEFGNQGIGYSKTTVKAKTKQTTQDSKCPKCEGGLIQSEKKDGTPFVKCENNIWDRNLRKNVGSCDFIEWDRTLDSTSDKNSASKAQRNLIQSKWPHEWEQGMTKQQASDLISSKFSK